MTMKVSMTDTYLISIFLCWHLGSVFVFIFIV